MIFNLNFVCFLLNFWMSFILVIIYGDLPSEAKQFVISVNSHGMAKMYILGCAMCDAHFSVDLK